MHTSSCVCPLAALRCASVTVCVTVCVPSLPSLQVCFRHWVPFNGEQTNTPQLQAGLRDEISNHTTSLLLVHRVGVTPRQALLAEGGEHALLVLQECSDKEILVWHLHSTWSKQRNTDDTVPPRSPHIGAFLAVAVAAVAEVCHGTASCRSP